MPGMDDIEAIQATLEDEEAAHQETLRLWTEAKAEIARLGEKTVEYRQVAGLVCMDLDRLAEIALTRGMTSEQLVKQILHTKAMKDKLIADAALRPSPPSAPAESPWIDPRARADAR